MKGKKIKKQKKSKKRGRPAISKRGRPSKPRKPRIAKIRVQAPRGTHDILPQEQKYWDKIRLTVAQVAKNYDFGRLDTPIFEDVRLYIKATGATTDIVQKEIYSFRTKSGENLALRPEFTPGIVRAYIEHGMKNLPQPVKLYSIGPVFRHDKPQAGRYRQFYQFNFEIIGDQSEVSDVQIIQVFVSILRRLNLKKFTLHINSIGCFLCAPKYKKALLNYYRQKLTRLCPDCKRRFEKNPLRLLDCKKDKCKKIAGGAPQILDFLCDECRTHFKKVLEILDDLEIPYILNPYLVRGLDYYTKTVFEVWEDKEDTGQGALLGGGRYDNLVEMFKGKSTPAVGAAAGMERIVLSLKKQDVKVSDGERPKVFLVQLGELGKRKSLKLFEEFQKKGIRIGEAFSKPSIKSQLKIADKEGVEMALILGQKEALEGSIIIRDMASGVQETMPIEKVINEVKKRLTK